MFGGTSLPSAPRRNRRRRPRAGGAARRRPSEPRAQGQFAVQDYENPAKTSRVFYGYETPLGIWNVTPARRGEMEGDAALTAESA
ncbi:jg27251 [Pararge aegeria aegeria]|uniref:Jg27251 protein n=1 Tax=Pararge aegeria aegeria TaxID=348720 RepID=A0A8S4RSM8_9NEOP|nr:jg27251 [Pararge aegeria aegeria]